MKDLMYVDIQSDLVQPTVTGKTSAQGLSIYQKVLVLILSSKYAAYRQNAGTDIITLLSGANTPDDALLTTLGSSACADVRLCLDQSDLQQISSLEALGEDGHLKIYLTLQDGSTYTGALL